MEPTRILAIRHGETAWNVDTRLQGHLDIPLNETGLSQAQHLARALAESEAMDAVYASDLSRALTTAQAIAQVCRPNRHHAYGFARTPLWRVSRSHLPRD